jgi:uncharacterized membrane protein YkvA (DUF1232 family)
MSLMASAKAWARRMKRDVVALWIAARDHHTPLKAKVVAAAVAAYALSPIDLIPDFVPILGYLDDLIIVPLGIVLAVRLIPEPLMIQFRSEALRLAERPTSRAGLTAVVVVWLLAAGLLLWAFWPAVVR